MLPPPPGLSFNAVSDKAMDAVKGAGSKRSYWDWHDMLGPNAAGFFPYTPATTLLYGLREALDMLAEEGLSSRMLLQVHDELVFECPEGEADTLIERVRTIMENAAHPVVDFTVPLTVDAGRGESWQAAH